jgi:tetratricopeptide (TPR) repeat protein
VETNELFNKAQILFIDGRYNDSIEEFSKALEAGSEPVITCLSRGVAYLKIKEHEKAIEDFSRVLEMNEKNASAYYYRGTVYMIMEDYEKAVSDFTNALKINPEHMSAVFARGVSLVNIGKDDDGARDIKRALVTAETAIQGFADSFGWRTQFDKVMALVEGDRRPETVELTDEEIETLKKYLKK